MRNKLFFLLIILLIPFGCDLPPVFGPEYKDSQRNFISILPITDPSTLQSEGVPLDELAIWDWAWRGQTGNDFEYMTITEHSGEGPDGIDAWLLETVSLIENRTLATGPFGWTSGHGGEGEAAITAGTLHSSAMAVDFASGSEFIYLSQGSIKDIDATPHSYTLVLNAHNTSNLRSLNTPPDKYAQENLQPLSWSGGGPFFVNFQCCLSLGASVIILSKLDTNTLLLDDISAIRTDIGIEKLSLVLRLALDSTEPVLVPGLYAFSVWVKKPDGYAFSTESGRGDNEDYAARFVTLSMTQFRGSGENLNSQTSAKSFNLSDGSVIFNADGWARLELRLDKEIPFFFHETAEGKVVELKIAAIGRQGAELEPGAVLISSPSLNFYMDGF